MRNGCAASNPSPHRCFVLALHGVCSALDELGVVGAGDENTVANAILAARLITDKLCNRVDGLGVTDY
jgi:hypothetical protein